MVRKRILCFGDSNTFGTNPTGGRHDENARWPMVLQTILGDDFRIIEEGLGGRTIAFDDPVEGGYKSAMQYLPPCILSHNPLDLIIIMLGTNDVKQRFSMSEQAIAQSMLTLIRLCRNYCVDTSGTTTRLLIVAPPPIRSGVLHTRMQGTFDLRSVDVSEKLAAEYMRASRLMRCGYLDAAEFCRVSNEDSVHLTADEHRALASGISKKTLDMFKEE